MNRRRGHAYSRVSARPPCYFPGNRVTRHGTLLRAEDGAMARTLYNLVDEHEQDLPEASKS